MYKRLLSVFFILNIFCFGLFAQFADLNNYVTRIWTAADGLPGNSITDILQASDGFMYFGTYEGLVKFDGYEFSVINKYNDENINFISARTIFEDSSDIMWIGSNDDGIQKINRNILKIKKNLAENDEYTVDNGLLNNSIRAFAEDLNHNIWVGTASGVSYITKNGQVVQPLCEDDIDLTHIQVSKLFCDTSGNIWLFGNSEKSIFVYSGDSFKRYTALDEIGDYIPTAITQDYHNNFIIALGNYGVVQISNDKIRKIISGTILDSVPVQSIFCDKNGGTWFGTEAGLVYSYGGDYVQYSENNSIKNASIQKINGDREGNIWVATSTGGIGKISPGKFSTTRMDCAVNAIAEDLEGNVWIGADDGLHCYKDNIEVYNELTDMCSGIRIRHVGITSEGYLLVNCYSKPSQIIMSDEGIANWTSDEGLVGNRTRVSVEISTGDLYCGTTSGLSIIHEDGNIKNFTVEDGLKNDFIMCIFEDSRGLVWIGTDGGGIYVFENEEIKYNLSSVNGLAGNVIFKIMQDSNDDVWICTGSGISRIEYDSGKIVNYTSANGLGSDSVFQIIDDEHGNFWMVSNRGISSAPIDNFNAVSNGTKKLLDCKFYNQNDGLKSSGANSTALSMKDRCGRIWFTMADGFAVYDPVRAKSNSVAPIIQLKEIKIDDEYYYDFSEEIVIPAGTKHIDIKYTGLSFIASERNKFIYKLEGFDDEYSELTSMRSVSYTNLKPGIYTFYVNIQNGEGVFADKPAEIVLVQKAFFYELLSFWIGFGIVVFIIVVLAFWFVNLINKKKRLILETQINMATVDLQIARDESDSLLRNILPDKIAIQLKSMNPGESHTIAEKYENVTVLFSDIVGFTNTTSNHTAEEIVSSLNELVSRFDTAAKKMKVEKIKTMGDAYMAVCGAPIDNPKHAEIMLKFATVMYKELYEYNKTAKIKFRIRVGLCSGSVIAGVIGKNKFIYDIWGDTVNVASRMESYCNPMHIRMTESVVENLERHGYHYDYFVEEVDVKGKGLMKTYELPKK